MTVDEYMDDAVVEEIDGVEVVDRSHVERFLTFVSDGLTYAINTSHVIEIITNHTITSLPLVPSYISGIINLRGAIVPIVDIRSRMGKMPADISNGNCIIVLDIDSVSLGIIIDNVSQVIDIDKSQISSMPANNHQELVNGMITIESGQTFLFLDCELLANR